MTDGKKEDDTIEIPTNILNALDNMDRDGDTVVLEGLEGDTVFVDNDVNPSPDDTVILSGTKTEVVKKDKNGEKIYYRSWSENEYVFFDKRIAPDKIQANIASSANIRGTNLRHTYITKGIKVGENADIGAGSDLNYCYVGKDVTLNRNTECPNQYAHCVFEDEFGAVPALEVRKKDNEFCGASFQGLGFRREETQDGKVVFSAYFCWNPETERFRKTGINVLKTPAVPLDQENQARNAFFKQLPKAVQSKLKQLKQLAKRDGISLAQALSAGNGIQVGKSEATEERKIGKGGAAD